VPKFQSSPVVAGQHHKSRQGERRPHRVDGMSRRSTISSRDWCYPLWACRSGEPAAAGSLRTAGGLQNTSDPGQVWALASHRQGLSQT